MAEGAKAAASGPARLEIALATLRRIEAAAVEGIQRLPRSQLACRGYLDDIRGEAARGLALAESLKDGPPRVCLCGSTRFRAEYEAAERVETLAGKIVLTVGLFGHLEGLDMAGPTKQMLDELHLRKIDLADEILVIDPGGYVGESTRREIAYAESLGKPVRYLEPPA